jgi:hypothetical protein
MSEPGEMNPTVWKILALVLIALLLSAALW